MVVWIRASAHFSHIGKVCNRVINIMIIIIFFINALEKEQSNYKITEYLKICYNTFDDYMQLNMQIIF
jgi:hypothetical protein